MKKHTIPVKTVRDTFNKSYRFLNSLWCGLKETGIDANYDEIRVANIKMTNELALLFGIIMAIGIPTIAILVNSRLFLYPVIIEFVINSIVLVLNRKEKHLAASSTVFYLQAAAIFYFSILLGEQIHMQFMVMFLILITPLIFSKRNHRVLAFTTSVFILVSVQFFYYNKTFPTVSISYHVGFTIQCFVIAGIVAIIAYVGRPYINSNDGIYKARRNSQLIKKEKRLTLHDLRYRMQQLANEAQKMKRKTKLDPMLRNITPQLDQMFSVLHTMGSEINSVLDDAEVESGISVRVFPQPTDIRHCFNLIVNLNNSLAITNNRFIKLVVSPSFPEVIITDKLLLQKITGNLFSNALKYANNSTEVNLLLTADDQSWHLILKNKGAEIPAEIQNKIFDQFTTHKSDQSISGYGLGLNSVRAKVEALGGTVSFKSNGGEVTLKATFPLVVASRDAMPVEPAEIIKNFENITILIADDDQVSLVGQVTVFKNNNCNIIEAYDGNEVISILQRAKNLPDVILLDNQMPNKSGLETLDYLKKHPIFKYIPVFMLSGDKDQTETFKQAGAVDVILKPVIEVTKVLSIVSQHLIKI